MEMTSYKNRQELPQTIIFLNMILRRHPLQRAGMVQITGTKPNTVRQLRTLELITSRLYQSIQEHATASQCYGRALAIPIADVCKVTHLSKAKARELITETVKHASTIRINMRRCRQTKKGKVYSQLLNSVPFILPTCTENDPDSVGVSFDVELWEYLFNDLHGRQNFTRELKAGKAEEFAPIESLNRLVATQGMDKVKKRIATKSVSMATAMDEMDVKPYGKTRKLIKDATRRTIAKFNALRGQRLANGTRVLGVRVRGADGYIKSNLKRYKPETYLNAQIEIFFAYDATEAGAMPTASVSQIFRPDLDDVREFVADKFRTIAELFRARPKPINVAFATEGGAI